MMASALIERMVDRYMAHDPSASPMGYALQWARRDVITMAIMDVYGVDDEEAGERLYAMTRIRMINSEKEGKS